MYIMLISLFHLESPYISVFHLINCFRCYHVIDNIQHLSFEHDSCILFKLLIKEKYLWIYTILKSLVFEVSIDTNFYFPSNAIKCLYLCIKSLENKELHGMYKER